MCLFPPIPLLSLLEIAFVTDFRLFMFDFKVPLFFIPVLIFFPRPADVLIPSSF